MCSPVDTPGRHWGVHLRRLHILDELRARRSARMVYASAQLTATFTTLGADPCGVCTVISARHIISRPPHPEGHLKHPDTCPFGKNDATVRLQSLQWRVIFAKRGMCPNVPNVLPCAEACNFHYAQCRPLVSTWGGTFAHLMLEMYVYQWGSTV